MNFRYRLMQFMSGRYGIDSMFYVLFGTAATISITNLSLRYLGLICPRGMLLLHVLVDVLVVFAVFRVLSRNHEARRRENMLVFRVIEKVRQHKNLKRRKKADYTHIYKKCPRCRAVLRLPRKKGKHKTVCPKCNKEFSVRVR